MTWETVLVLARSEINESLISAKDTRPFRLNPINIAVTYHRITYAKLFSQWA
jgi:hypothetical protein